MHVRAKNQHQKHLINEVRLRPATLSLKKMIWHRCFHVDFAKYLGTPFLTEHLQWQLLHVLSLHDQQEILLLILTSIY